MNRVTPLSEIESLENVAHDLKGLLRRDDNVDIAQDFPSLVARYARTDDGALRNLELLREQHEAGRREKFVVFVGERAVGLGVVIAGIDSPNDVDRSWPNLSGFICNPYRGQSLGKLSIERRMLAVRHNFGNHAWTLVRSGNVPSERLVTGAGFVKDVHNEHTDGKDLYLFGS
jgi:L-amino acid N-acyltransferase YncA